MKYEKPYEKLDREEQSEILLKRLDDFIQYAEATNRYADLDLYVKLKEYIEEAEDMIEGLVVACDAYEDLIFERSIYE